MVSELEYQENCQSNQYSEETRECNSWDREKCPSPCERVKCPAFAKCQANQLFSYQIILKPLQCFQTFFTFSDCNFGIFFEELTHRI